MVLQPPLVFPMSVRDNIAYGRPDASDDEIESAARLARIDGLIRGLPQGLRHRPRRQRDTLGGREAAPDDRARHPARRTDPDPRRADLGARRRDRGDGDGRHQPADRRAVPTFIIAHRLSTVRSADLILVLRDGKIAESGSFANCCAPAACSRRSTTPSSSTAPSPKSGSQPRSSPHRSSEERRRSRSRGRTTRSSGGARSAGRSTPTRRPSAPPTG